MHADLESIVCKFGSDPALCLREEAIKVVIWLPVNRLPVKLPVTGFNFQLPVTDLLTFFLHVMQFSASSSSHVHTHRRTKTGLHWTQTYRRRPTARSRWFRFTQYLTVESAPLPSPHQVAVAGKGGREEVRTGWPAWMTQS